MRSVDAGREPPVVGYVLYFPKVARNSHVNLSNVEIESLELQRLWGVYKSSGTRITCDFWLISGMATLLSCRSCHGLADAGQVGEGLCGSASQAPSLVGGVLAASLWRGQKNAQPLHLGVLVCQRPLDVRARHAQAFSNECSARHKVTVCHAVMHRLVTTLSTVLTGVWGLRARVLWWRRVSDKPTCLCASEGTFVRGGDKCANGGCDPDRPLCPQGVPIGCPQERCTQHLGVGCAGGPKV